MSRRGRYRGRRAPFIALAAVLAVGTIAGIGFNAVELRGVSAAVPTRTVDAQPAATAGQPALGRLAFRDAFDAGLAFLRQGDAHRAAQAFETARRANPHAAEVHVNLGFSYLELQQPAAARALFERASILAPGQVNAYFGLAEALEALGDIDGATGAMRTYLHLAPDDDPFRRRALSALWEWESHGAASPPPSAGNQTGSPAETGIALFDTPLQGLDGKPATLADYRGRFVILNIWASWCAPCRAELPSLQRLSATLDPDRFAVAGISTDQEPAFTREFLAGMDVRFPNYWDGNKRLAGEIIPVRAIPLTLIISPQGEVLLGYEGARDWSEPELIDALEALADDDAPFPERVANLQEFLQ